MSLNEFVESAKQDFDCVMVAVADKADDGSLNAAFEFSGDKSDMLALLYAEMHIAARHLRISTKSLLKILKEQCND